MIVPASAADVLQIGDRALQVVAVLAHERQLPERLRRRPAGGEERVDERLVVAEHAGVERAERDARTRR